MIPDKHKITVKLLTEHAANNAATPTQKNTVINIYNFIINLIQKSINKKSLNELFDIILIQQIKAVDNIADIYQAAINILNNLAVDDIDNMYVYIAIIALIYTLITILQDYRRERQQLEKQKNQIILMTSSESIEITENKDPIAISISSKSHDKTIFSMESSNSVSYTNQQISIGGEIELLYNHFRRTKNKLPTII